MPSGEPCLIRMHAPKGRVASEQRNLAPTVTPHHHHRSGALARVEFHHVPGLDAQLGDRSGRYEGLSEHRRRRGLGDAERFPKGTTLIRHSAILKPDPFSR